MSEYSENTGREKSSGKKNDSNKPPNRKMDYFGENPAKLDNLLSESGKKHNREQKNDYFGEKPEKLDQILSTSNKKNKKDKEKLTNRKLDEFAKKPLEFSSSRPFGKDQENKQPLKYAGPGGLYNSPPRIVTKYTKDGRPVKVKVYPDGREKIVIGDKEYPIYNSMKTQQNKSKSSKTYEKNHSPKQKPISSPPTNKIFGEDAPTFKLNKNPITQIKPSQKDKPNPKYSSSKQNSFSATSKIFGKDAPTYKLNKNPINNNEKNSKNEPNQKDKTDLKDKADPNIDYLSIPIVEDPNILEKILKNPPEKITDKANKTVETGRMYYMKNEITKKRYIGQTTQTINERLNAHFREAKSKRDNTYLNNSIRKHGRENFTIHEFQKIENQKQWALNGLETHYIKKYRTDDRRYGYNIAPGGKGGKHSPETIEKIKQSNIKAKAPIKGIPLSEEHRRKISQGLTGLKKSEETKEKIAQSHRGKILSEETKEKLSRINTGEKNPFFGKKHSESTIKKMSDNKKGDKNPFHGKHHSEESKQKISRIHKDIPNTPEQKRKISETKIQNFKDANPIDELAFKNTVRNGTTTKEIAEEFELRRSAVHTWLGHLFGTSKITEARKKTE